MSSMQYDLAIIGSGPGGYVAALRAAQLGLKTACIEKHSRLGGTCLNVGCIPSKALLESSHQWEALKKLSSYGIDIANASFDFKKMMDRKESIVLSFHQGISALFKRAKIDHFHAEASFQSPHELLLKSSDGDKVLVAKSIVIATGSVPIPLPFLPFDERTILSSTGALALPSVPSSLAIIGAGVIGLELGSVYKRLGSKVILIEALDRIGGALDLEVSKELQKALEKESLEFHLSTKLISAKEQNGKVLLSTQTGSNNTDYEVEKVLVSIGRKPLLPQGLEKIGITLTSRGQIAVNDRFETNIPHIHAIGDVIDGPMLAHKASDEGIAVAEKISGSSLTKVCYAAIPGVIYTDPEVGQVGFTEEQLKEKGIAHKVGKFSFRANSRARCSGEEGGFVKMIASSEGRILGIHIIHPKASELIASGVIAILENLSVEAFMHSPMAHPTLSEALKEAALATEGRALHQ